jgi:O6-methylguanine-DNA--protein-cysteine methyltransferase
LPPAGQVDFICFFLTPRRLRQGVSLKIRLKNFVTSGSSFLIFLILLAIVSVPKGEETMQTFAEKTYDLLRRVPKGRVTTYKEIAHALGSRAYRGVGQAMRRNPYAPEVP